MLLLLLYYAQAKCILSQVPVYITLTVTHFTVDTFFELAKESNSNNL